MSCTGTASPSSERQDGSECINASTTKLEKFHLILSRMRQSNLSEYAANVRNSKQGERLTSLPVIDETPMFGSFNIVFTLRFEDGVQWCMKAPSNGVVEYWNETDAKALHSEASTMKLLRGETTVPVPEVFAFDCSIDNQLGYPFILMEYINNCKPLYELWWDDDSPRELVQQRRLRALSGIASAMLQLQKFTFEKGGALEFDQQGQVMSIGPYRRIDYRAMKTGPAGFQPYQLVGPFDDAVDWFTNALQTEPSNADDALLQKFIEWLPMSEYQIDGCQFALSHPDLNEQNILVSEEGEVRAIIDWDNCTARPLIVGNQSFPSFLFQPWYLDEWNDSEEDQGDESAAFYRRQYEYYVQTGLDCQNVQNDNSAAMLTHKSLIGTALSFCDSSPNVASEKICEELLISLWKADGEPEEFFAQNPGESDSSSDQTDHDEFPEPTIDLGSGDKHNLPNSEDHYAEPDKFTEPTLCWDTRSLAKTIWWFVSSLITEELQEAEELLEQAESNVSFLINNFKHAAASLSHSASQVAKAFHSHYKYTNWGIPVADEQHEVEPADNTDREDQPDLDCRTAQEKEDFIYYADEAHTHKLYEYTSLQIKFAIEDHELLDEHWDDLKRGFLMLLDAEN